MLLVAQGSATSSIYGQVWVEGLTNLPGAGGGIAAELGYGPDGSDPASNASWQWVTAGFNTDVGGNDEYVAALVVNTAGSYDYAYRFKRGTGPWRYGDFDGTANGYSSDKAGALTVTGLTAGIATEHPMKLTLTLEGANPAMAEARFRLGLPTAAHVNLSVHDVTGRLVACLVDGDCGPGYHVASWLPRETRTPAGIYFARLVAGGRVLTRKLVLLE